MIIFMDQQIRQLLRYFFSYRNSSYPEQQNWVSNIFIPFDHLFFYFGR